MSIPFTLDQFLAVFAAYNLSVWPAQIVLFILGIALAVVAFGGRPEASRLVALGLALLWMWMAVVYHLTFFRPINPAAVAFGVAFVVQAGLFVVWAIRADARGAGRVTGPRAWIGAAILAYALLGHPVLGIALGHRYPAAATFGLPCPTTIATLGLFVWMQPAPRWWLWIVPALWVGVGTVAAVSLGIREDFGLLAAGIAAAAWTVGHARAAARVSHSATLPLGSAGPVLRGK